MFYGDVGSLPGLVIYYTCWVVTSRTYRRGLCLPCCFFGQHKRLNFVHSNSDMLTILHIEMRPSMNNELTNSETVHVKSRCRKMNLCGVEI